MSKGLEDLEKLGNEYPSEGDTLYSQYSERFAVIEKELKEHEELINKLSIALNLNECQSVKEWVELMQKKLKALDIIKTNCDVHNIIDFCVKNEKERDLLKEVLL